MIRAATGTLVAALGLLAATTALGETGYTDAAGDAGTAPDITAVTVSNDPGLTSVSFRVSVALRPGTMLMLVLDTDRNAGTGWLGAERGVAVIDASTTLAVQWNGSRWVSGPGVATASIGSDRLDLTLPRTEFGLGETFGFFVWTAVLGDSSNVDSAPDGGQWSYTLSQPAPPPAPSVVRPVIGSPLALPGRPTAGKRFAISFAVTRSDTGAPLAGATMSITPTIAGKALAHTESYRAGTARMTLTVPAAARAKTLKVSLTITADGQTARKDVAFKVR